MNWQDSVMLLQTLDNLFRWKETETMFDSPICGVRESLNRSLDAKKPFEPLLGQKNTLRDFFEDLFVSKAWPILVEESKKPMSISPKYLLRLYADL